MMTPGGCVMPLQVCSGLAHMDMRPPTDAELDTHSKDGLPQTILTSDLDWVPSSVDHEHDVDQWFDAMEDLPELDSDLPFDENGEHQCTLQRFHSLGTWESGIWCAHLNRTWTKWNWT